VPGLDVLRKIKEGEDMLNRPFEFLAAGLFRESLDAERFSFTGSSVTRVSEIERLLLPLLEVGL
jgi:hypothetical protein